MKHKGGHVEVICGSMFCGKTEELIRRLRRAIIAKRKIQVFKPSLDDRYGIHSVASHNGQNIQADLIDCADDIRNRIKPETTVIAVDESQFLDAALLPLITELADDGLRVILAGLDQDFRGEPFGIMPQLMAIADDVTKLHAICMVCGESASRTQRLVNGNPAQYDDPIIMVGATESYEARCRTHHIVPGKPNRT